MGRSPYEALASALGRRTTNRAPPSGASSMWTLPPWPSAIARTIARPRPAPPPARPRPSSRRVKRSKTRSRSARRDARPVVVDDEPHRALAGAHRDSGPRLRAWLDALSSRLRDQAAQLPRVAEDSSRGHPRRVDRHRPHAGRLLEDQVVDVDLDRVRPAPLPRRRASSRSSPTAPSRRWSSSRTRRATRRPVGLVAAAQRDLELGADRRDRAAQLVGRVGDELALARSTTPRAGRASRSSCGRGAPPRRSWSGSGTRRWIVEPVIDAASARIGSTGPQRPARQVPGEQRDRRGRAAARRGAGRR